MRTAPPTPFRAVLASAWISRQRAGKRWLLPVLVAVLMLVLALAVTFEAPVDGRRFLDVGPVVLCAMLGLGVLALTFVAWASLLSDVLRQNHPCCGSLPVWSLPTAARFSSMAKMRHRPMSVSGRSVLFFSIMPCSAT